jgi:antibiotic biosynthesis monooxygenase (ABM) superfamily enzyme
MDLNVTMATEPPRVESDAQAPAVDRRDSGRPRAKLALLTWAGAYAVIMSVLAIAGPSMASWPLGLRALVLSGVMVAAMTWVIVPVMTRVFQGWLRR